MGGALQSRGPGIRPLGAASRWWLHHSLTALADSVDGHLVLRRGAAEEVIPAIVAETDAAAVYWNRRYSAARDIDARLKLFVEEPVVEDPVGTPAYRGREAVRGFWKAYRRYMEA